MSPFTAILECLRGDTYAATLTPSHNLPSKVQHPAYHSEKILLPPNEQPIHRTAESTASDILTALFSATKAGRDLEATVNDIALQFGGWSEHIAQYVLDGLKKALQSASALKGPAKEAYERACEAAMKIEGLAKEHPYYAATILTVIALGVLIILAPAVIHALGFGVLGPVEGSFAAAWQSTYGGMVEAGSLFSYLQKLGMLY
ncbi:hypothetical protein W97_05104 [Coniosporium apollinis CBS 100218]|uniref:Uncharacterized protein n=1 Tax=Coniosporium apollinis (strain CBS 100218) TaxID=1168221 RepID=R7YVC5_CONA1|nr:uncharacterized protein W97_05104 [Coniosporium apollinis CBS 100218]EON65862.1 hypothetical protein W97_05104 [Coniosporium apollinis CBS 100218]